MPPSEPKTVAEWFEQCVWRHGDPGVNFHCKIYTLYQTLGLISVRPLSIILTYNPIMRLLFLSSGAGCSKSSRIRLSESGNLLIPDPEHPAFPSFASIELWLPLHLVSYLPPSFNHVLMSPNLWGGKTIQVDRYEHSHIFCIHLCRLDGKWR